MNITQTFLSGVKNCEEFSEAISIVKKNSSGKIWLVGGFVYRTVASQLYGFSKPDVDLDFIVEYPISDFDLPKGWRINKNKYGNPKLINNKKQIDYMPLGNIHSILQRQIKPTIENFLTGVPLNVQSIAYDVHKKKIIGELGINALQNRIVKTNNFHFAEYAAKKKNQSLQEMIQKKADQLGFKAILR